MSDASPPITVARPLLPDAHELLPYLEDLIQRRWVTNNGPYVNQLESELGRFLGTPEVAAVTNATVGLDLAVRAVASDGEVITTGYSFPATYHVLLNNPALRPVFVDIDDNYGLDPAAVADAITPQTRAILAVHTYGYPVDVERFEELGKHFGIPVVYDAAHTFGVTLGGRGIATYGDLSVFSFHATKVFNTLEGGAITAGMGKEALLERVRLLRNFGIVNEEEIALVGLNGKMDEVRAVFGLVTLPRVRQAIEARRKVVDRYLGYFAPSDPEVVQVRTDMYRRDGLCLNYAYFPVMVHPRGGVTRDTLYDYLKTRGILARKYFYPTITSSPIYRGLYNPERLPKTAYATSNVLCLPVHHEMTETDCNRIITAVDDVLRGRS